MLACMSFANILKRKPAPLTRGPLFVSKPKKIATPVVNNSFLFSFLNKQNWTPLTSFITIAENNTTVQQRKPCEKKMSI